MEDWDDMDYQEIDIPLTIGALDAAWKCVPHVTLSELLDMATPAPFAMMTNEELVEALNEFTLQNQ